MLTKNALESAVPLTDIMDNSQLYLVPKPGTVLEALVQATRVPLNQSNPEYVPTLGDIEYMANAADPTTGHNAHDIVMDEAAAAGIQGIQAFLAHAQTVVAPTVLELVAKVQEDLKAVPASALRGMEVISVLVPEILYNNGFVKEVMKFQEMPYDDPALQMRLPTLPTSEIRDLMKVGGGQLEEQVAVWLAGKGDNWLIDLWENIFQVKQLTMEQSGKPVSFGSLINDPIEGRDRAIAVYLIARRLADQGAPDNTDMPGQFFTKLICEYRDQAALVLCREIEKVEAAAKAGNMLIRSEGKKVWVDAKMYDAWLSNGGSIEVLYGNILDGSNRRTIAQIDEAATGLLDMWNKHEKLTRLAEDGQRFVRTKALIGGHFRNSLLTLSEEEKKKTDPNAAMDRFAKEMEQIRPIDMENLFDLCLRLVCRARFFYTDAEVLLSTADSIMKKDPNVTDREAFAMATIQYVINWTAEQFDVKSMGAPLGQASAAPVIFKAVPLAA